MTDDDAPPIDDLEARALWHLELEQRARFLSDADLDDGPDDSDVYPDLDDDDRGAYLGDSAYCWNCDDGVEVWCIDDLCRGAGYCMHGDGNRPCRVCGGRW